jgi:hypothetical protein
MTVLPFLLVHPSRYRCLEGKCDEVWHRVGVESLVASGELLPPLCTSVGCNGIRTCGALLVHAAPSSGRRVPRPDLHHFSRLRARLVSVENAPTMPWAPCGLAESEAFSASALATRVTPWARRESRSARLGRYLDAHGAGIYSEHAMETLCVLTCAQSDCALRDCAALRVCDSSSFCGGEGPCARTPIGCSHESCAARDHAYDDAGGRTEGLFAVSAHRQYWVSPHSALEPAHPQLPSSTTMPRSRFFLHDDQTSHFFGESQVTHLSSVGRAATSLRRVSLSQAGIVVATGLRCGQRSLGLTLGRNRSSSM